jgi:hypothetical protein
MGTIPFMAFGILLMGGGLFMGFYQRKRRRKNMLRQSRDA